MNNYSVIWIREEIRKDLKRTALDKEMSMRELGSNIIEAWLQEEKKKKERSRNETIKPPGEVRPKKQQDAK